MNVGDRIAPLGMGGTAVELVREYDDGWLASDGSFVMRHMAFPQAAEGAPVLWNTCMAMSLPRGWKGCRADFSCYGGLRDMLAGRPEYSGRLLLVGYEAASRHEAMDRPQATDERALISDGGIAYSYALLYNI